MRWRFLFAFCVLCASAARAAMIDQWSLDETSGTTLTDSGSGGHNATTNDDVGGGNPCVSNAGAAATTGTSLYSSGSCTGNVPNSAGNFPFVVIGTGQTYTGFTFAFWLRGISGSSMVFGKANGTNDHDWGLFVSSIQTIYLSAKGTGGDTAICDPSVSLTSPWHHYVGTYDGTNLKVYQDGALKCTHAGPASNTIRNSTGSTLRMFSLQTSGIDGTLDEVRLYDTACATDDDCRAIFCDSGGDCGATPTITPTATNTPTQTPTPTLTATVTPTPGGPTYTPTVPCNVTADCPGGRLCHPTPG